MIAIKQGNNGSFHADLFLCFLWGNLTATCGYGNIHPYVKEMAKMENLSENAFKVKINRIRNKIRTGIEEKSK